MPELPELKVYAAALDERLKGRKIAGASASAFSLAGGTIARVFSHGKKTYFETERGTLSVHLMLGGEFYLDPPDDLSRVSSLLFTLETDGGTLGVADVSRYARVSVGLPDSVPEPLSPAFTPAYFASLFSCRAVVKNLLTDQKKIGGVGNAYADEALYLAGVHPLSKASAIPFERVSALYDALERTLGDAIRTLRERFPGCIRGEYRRMRVHDPDKRFTDAGEPIERIEVGGRKTYFTAAQVLYGGRA